MPFLYTRPERFRIGALTPMNRRPRHLPLTPWLT